MIYQVNRFFGISDVPDKYTGISLILVANITLLTTVI